MDSHSTVKPLLAAGCPHALPAGPTTAQAPQEAICEGSAGQNHPSQGHIPGCHHEERHHETPKLCSPHRAAQHGSPTRRDRARGEVCVQGLCCLKHRGDREWGGINAGSGIGLTPFPPRMAPPRDSPCQRHRDKGRKQDPAPSMATFTPCLLDLDLLKAVQTARFRAGLPRFYCPQIKASLLQHPHLSRPALFRVAEGNTAPTPALR